MSGPLYFKQWLSGRDFATDDEIARSMRNFTYAVGDLDAGVAVVVDPAYRPEEIIELVRADGLEVVGALATHYHPDHIGGRFMNQRIDGVAELFATMSIPVHVQSSEADLISQNSDTPRDALSLHEDQDILMVGSIAITLLRTPGHSPGSQCILVEEHLMSGDTLFIDGCGRTDLPGGDASELYESLMHRLKDVTDDTVLYPGHLYSPEPFLTMGAVRERNYVLEPRSAESWLAMFGS